MSEYKPWFLKDLKPPTENAPTVFSCFHCGGGSTMGYKLAGFKVLGGVEIDPKMMEVYRKNHNPKHSYLMGVQDFKLIPLDQLPKELFSLDVLDGSPPCSSFSMSGLREKAWGDKKKFREGQAEQVLDELFFDFIDIAKNLQPKIVIAENVKGLIFGNAKSYVKRINQAFEKAGYSCQLFLLNAAFMGVPQRRERTFFIARRKDIGFENLKLEFNGELIPINKALVGVKHNHTHKFLSEKSLARWNETAPGSFAKSKTGNTFGFMSKESPTQPCMTITGNPHSFHWKEPRQLCGQEIARLQTFPDDFDFGNQDPGYFCGMSVPPRMMEKIALELRKQWLNNFKLRKKYSTHDVD